MVSLKLTTSMAARFSANGTRALPIVLSRQPLRKGHSNILMLFMFQKNIERMRIPYSCNGNCTLYIASWQMGLVDFLRP